MGSVEVVIIGGGISGLATLKCLLDAGVEDVVLLERTDRLGGLWTFRESEAYGVMAFTHINVSKPNYSFSDFPFPAGGPDFVHHATMSAYVRAYADHFGLVSRIKFGAEVRSVSLNGDRVEVKTQDATYSARRVAVASGHHVSPKMVEVVGQERYSGTLLHSASFKSAAVSGGVGDSVVMGIGNSAVDVAAELARAGQGKVFLSTRSGAWLFPNYLFGMPADLYANRLFLALPWRLGSVVMEAVLCLLSGHPRRWGLNPKMRVLQTQPTVSPTLVHHIQRGQVEIVGDVEEFTGGQRLRLRGGREIEAARVVMCTGFNIGFPFLHQELADKCFDKDSHELKLFKNVFAPEIGDRIAFIGFAQPASGGLLPISEIQARWFAEIVKGRATLPSRPEMERCVAKENAEVRERYFHSPRHTIQREPIIYCDDIAARIGAKPSFLRHPTLAWRLLLGSCGTSQWRLQGPNAWPGAAEEVRRVPVTPLMNLTGAIIVLTLCLLVTALLRMSGLL